jgi:hypothetical protein
MKNKSPQDGVTVEMRHLPVDRANLAAYRNKLTSLW